MNITIFTIGSRGDVQPYVALGRRLQSAGHRVAIATYAYYRDFIEAYGLAIRPFPGNPQELMSSSIAREWVSSQKNPVRFIRSFIELTKTQLEPMFSVGTGICADADLILYSDLGLVGQHMAEYFDTPSIQTHLQPFGLTREFPAVGSPPWLRLGGTYNRFSHLLTDQVMWQPFRSHVNEWRQAQLRLPPAPFFGPYRQLKKKQQPVFSAFSPTVVPKPADWASWHHVTGYWFLPPPPGWTPPQDLVDFIQAGPPPVYIGFGSMYDGNPHALTQMVLSAVQRAGVRVVLSSGWGGFAAADLPENAFVLSSIPHEWLFPNMAAVVHHGGAGTTAAGLRAGVPNIVVPYFADQYFWGKRVHRLGVGPKPIARQRLNEDRLTAVLQQATQSATMKQQAADIGRRIRAEDGTGVALSLIERYMEQGIVTGVQKRWRPVPRSPRLRRYLRFR
ncbi:MAG: glycosyltransferase family 1 protein [Anaerolineales bacterium]|nr:glycosyltransferase family 1 protein [Anaerolineales bacterium]